jgi:hypothetical protein
MLLLLPCLAYGQYSQRGRRMDDLFKEKPVDTFGFRIDQWKAPKVDEQKAREVGIRKLQSKHLTLYTDLPSSSEVDALPQIFDDALPQWCEFLGIPQDKSKEVHLVGAIMKQRRPFEVANIIPANMPPFPNGFAINNHFWLFEQPSAYYRRHLLLHEGVHSLMNSVLGSCGPPWYMESTAEYLGTHRMGKDGKVVVGTIPKNREEVPMWGRIKMIRDAAQAGNVPTLDEIFRLGPDAYFNNTNYAWSWAVAMFLDRSPKTRKIYRALAKHTTDPNFNQRARRMLQREWRDLNREWLLMIDSLDYGYDTERTTVDMKPGRLFRDGNTRLTVTADRGWQNSGLRLEKGKTYKLSATGRYRIVQGKEGKPDWISEPNGVSIRYFGGRPLGMVQAAILPTRAGKTFPLFKPVDVGLGTTFTPERSGTLLLRINDSPGELEENQGQAFVKIEAS